MQTRPIQLTEVIYNAANQTFEALVTVHDGDLTRKYACAIDAPISMTFADAASGLQKQALRRYQSRGGMFSEARQHVPALRAGRPVFDPRRWLEGLIRLPGRDAA